MKTLLFIGGSIETVPALSHAKDLSYQVFVTDQNPNSDGVQWTIANDAFYGIADTYDADETIKAVKEVCKQFGAKIDGVLAVGCDVGPTVSLVARELGLPHIPHSITKLSWDKQLLKAWLYPGKIPVPPAPDITDKYWVIKPVDSRGGRGVFRVPAFHHNGTPSTEVEGWIKKAREMSLRRKIMLERWIPGPQISAETIVQNRQNYFTGLTDRNYSRLEEFMPYIIEDGGEGPSQYSQMKVATKINDIIQRVIDHLGIEAGTFKSDFVLDAEHDHNPVLIECAIGRLSGGYSCSHHLPLAYAVDFLGAAFAIACGEDCLPYLEQTKEPVFTCGRYEMPKGAQNATQRGQFYFAIGGTREESIKKAEAMREDNDY